MSVRRYPATTYPRELLRSTFDANITGWTAGANTGSLTRDTTVDAGRPGAAGAALRFQSTGSANFSVISPSIAIDAGVECTVFCRVRIGAAAQRYVVVTVDEFDSGFGYINGYYDAAGRIFQAGTDWWHYSMSFRTAASVASMQLSISVQTAAASGEQAWVDNVFVFV